MAIDSTLREMTSHSIPDGNCPKTDFQDMLAQNYDALLQSSRMSTCGLKILKTVQAYEKLQLN